MKNRKLLNAVTALTCAATLGLGIFAGCKDEGCEHVYNWTELQASTCTTAGKQQGVCSICGDIIEEELPLNEGAHVFDEEWAITNPTENAEGLATKVCRENAEHKVEVTLPKVSFWGIGYDEKEFITVPTAATAGKIHLELNSEHGKIAFDAPIEKLKVLDDSGEVIIDNAVMLASSLQKNVRSGTGTVKETNQDTGAVHKFSYYFGDDYTYVDDGINEKKSWYSLDDEGKVFAMEKSGNSLKPTAVADADKSNLNGYRYESMSSVSSFYGAEAGLLQIYETAKRAEALGNCVKFETEAHKIDEPGMGVGVNFSYGLLDGSFFCRYKVYFDTLSDASNEYCNGTLNSLSVETEIIRDYMIATQSDTTRLFYKEGDSFTDDYGISHQHAKGDVVFGYVYPTSQSGGNDYEYDANGDLVYEQVDDLGRVIYTTVENGETVYKPVIDGTKEIVYPPQGKPYYKYTTVYGENLSEKPTLHDVYFKDKYGTEILDSEGNKIKKIMAKGGYPVTEYYSDDHPEVNYRTITFAQKPKVEGEVVTPNPYDSNSLYVSSFDIQSANVGGSTVDFVDGTATLPTNQVINLKLGNVQPSTAGFDSDPITAIYVVDQTGRRIKLSMEFNNGSPYKIFAAYSQEKGITLNSKHAGEVNFVAVTKSGKCEKEFTITFGKSAPTVGQLTARASVYTVLDGTPSYIEQEVGETTPVTVIQGQTLKFKAVALGELAAYVSTDIYPSTTGEGIEFTRSEEGSNEEWNLVASKAGEYVIKMPYYDGSTASDKVYTSFKLIVNERKGVMETLSGNTFEGAVKISNGENTNPAPKKLTAAFGTDGKINISVGDTQVVYTYGVNEKGELTAARESGIDYGFVFSINDAGDLEVTHVTGMGEPETVVLTKKAVA